MKIVDYTSQQTTEISGDWRDWLEGEGYVRPPDFAPDEMTLALIESREFGKFAVYHPPVGYLKTECVYVEIPSESEAENLLDLAMQMITGPLSLLSAASDAVQSRHYPSA